jgi:hypothetical protein
MLKKLIAILTALNFSFIYAQSFVINEPILYAPSYKIYLAINGNDNNTGDSISPVATFAGALTKLDQLTGSFSGNLYAEIIVFPGTYTEIFRQPLNKFQIGSKFLNVSLRGKGNVILDGTNLTVNAGGGMIYLLGSNIYVKNIKVQHSNENGIRFGYNYNSIIINSHDILIDSVEVSETAGHGILVGIGALNANGSSSLIPRAKRFKITNAHVYNSVNYNTPQSQWGSAIKFWNTSNNLAINNHVHDNSGEGIDFDYCDSAIVRKNVLHDNYANIYLDKMVFALIEQNFIYNETKVVSGILTGLEAFTSFITNHYIKDIYIENNIILNTLGINLWQGIYSAIQNGIYNNIKIRHNTIIGKQFGNGALVSISHETFLGQPVSNFSISGISIDRNIVSANPDSLNNGKLFSAPLNPQPGLTSGYNLFNINPGFSYNSTTDQINAAVSTFEDPMQAVFNLTPNSVYNSELIMSSPAIILNDYNGLPRNSINSNVGALELNQSLNLKHNESSDLIVFPNPSKGLFFIETNEFIKISKIECYDITGRCVYSDSILFDASFDLSSIESGMYNLILYSADQTKIFKKIQILR